MTGISKKIETAANLAVIFAALVFVVVAVRHYVTGKTQETQRISVGAKFALPNINWQDSKKSVVLGLSTNCRFCTESAGFYRELVGQCRQRHVRTIAVFLQSVSAADAYLKSQNIQVDEIRQAELPAIGIGGTPTVLMINDSGLVQNVWIGKLPEKIENEVLSKAIR